MDNRYFLPGLLLCAVLGVLSLFVLKTHRGLARERSDLDAKVIELEAANTNVAKEAQRLDQMKASSTPSNTFMNQWKKELGAGKDGNSMLTDLSKLGNDTTVSVQGRKSGSSEYLWKGKPARVQFAEGVGVSGEYYRLINWMGEMERSWPIARFEQIAFEQKGPSLQLFLKLSYPSFLTENAAQ